LEPLGATKAFRDGADLHTVTIQIGSFGCEYWLKDFKPLANTAEDTEAIITRLTQFVPELDKLPVRANAASIFC